MYGNSLGHQVLAEREEFRADLQATKTKIANLETAIATLETEVGILKSQNKELILACDGYMLIRERFLDIFRRDILKSPNAKWTTAIGAGNAAAHHGDAVTDASLYEKGRRKDRSLFSKIYGLDPIQILELSEYRPHLVL